MAWAEKRGKKWRSRYLRPDGRYGSEPGFDTKAAALEFGQEQDRAIKKGTWIDPELGQQLVDDFWTEWFPLQRMSDSTRERYAGYFRNHLSPLLGAKKIGEVRGLHIAAVRQALPGRGLQESTIVPMIGLLRRMFEDAELDRRIGHCPVPRENRRGEKKPAPPKAGRAVELEAVLRVCARLPLPEALMVVTTVVGGFRWGEAAGHRREFLFAAPADGETPAAGWYDVDAKVGALKELKGKLSFGPPKDREARMVEQPPFLVEMYLAYFDLVAPSHRLMFPGTSGSGERGLPIDGYRRSTFGRQLWRPACDGWESRKTVQGHRGFDAAPPVVKGLRFHDLRHTCETWMTEDGIPKIARDARLGHETAGMEGTYNHVTPTMKAMVLDSFTRRWERTLAASPELFAPLRLLLPESVRENIPLPS